MSGSPPRRHIVAERRRPEGTPRRIGSELPDVEIEVVQFKRGGAVPYFWMQGVPTDEFESVVRNDRGIPEFQRLERADGRALYRVEWVVDAPVIHCVASTDGVVVRAHGTVDEWRLDHPVRGQIGRRDGSGVLYDPGRPARRPPALVVDRTLSEDSANLSQPQYEAMVLAYREGASRSPDACPGRNSPTNSTGRRRQSAAASAGGSAASSKGRYSTAPGDDGHTKINECLNTRLDCSSPEPTVEVLVPFPSAGTGNPGRREIHRAVIEAVSDAAGVDPCDLDPIHEAVDPDALNALFAGRTEGAWRVVVPYHGYHVTVHGDGDVTLAAP